MRSTRLLAVAALVALPFGTTAVAAPASPGTAKAASGLDTRPPVVQVKKGGGPAGFSMGGFKGGGFKGAGPAFRGAGPAFRGGGFRGGGPAALRGARSPMAGLSGGGPKAYRALRPGNAAAFGGRGKGKGYYKGKRHHHAHRRKFRGRYIVGYPYFYDYGPSYYDDYYYDDGGYDDAGYADDAVARCAARYRSFDPASGTYLHVSGERRRCPYLG